jgi:GR25 family glycosyltransferase involved in LPS biosynthesis
MKINNMTIIRGINGTQAMQKTKETEDLIALYTRYVMLTGRSDHMQLSNPSMLGCLLSHIQIWNEIKESETVAIFEEDAYMDETSSQRLYSLSIDMHNIEWDVLMLESGQIIASGVWEYIGKYAATCSSNKTGNAITGLKKNLCTWFGTRGYLITYDGAQKLLSHAFPVHVQIDALMGLLAAFNKDFKMYWTRENIVHQRILYITQVWDACLKCYMPQQTIFYLIMLIAIFGLLWKTVLYVSYCLTTMFSIEQKIYIGA